MIGELYLNKGVVFKRDVGKLGGLAYLTEEKFWLILCSSVSYSLCGQVVGQRRNFSPFFIIESNLSMSCFG